MIDKLKTSEPRSFIYASAIIAMAVAAGLTKLLDFDIWWHIKTGWFINRFHFVPDFDIFSYTASGAPWTNHEWLFQVFSAAAFYNLGLWPFTIFQFVCALAIFWTMYETIKLLCSSKSAAIWGVVIIALAIADRMTARPYLVSLVLTALFCLGLHAYRAGKLKNLWWMPIATIAWVNFHAGAIMAAPIIGAFAFGETLQSFFTRRSPGEDREPMEKTRIEHLWIVFVATIGACLINPYGVDSILFPILHVKMDTILTFTQEWLPAFDARLDPVISQIVFKIILILAPISFLVNLKKARLSHLGLCALAAALTLKGKRFTPDFAVIALPIVVYNFKAIASRIPITASCGHLHAWGNALLACLIAAMFLQLGIPATVMGGNAGEPGFGTTGRFAPARMIRFLDENKIHGKVLNDMGVGGFLILTRWPSDQVFIDGRTPVFGDDFFKQYITSLWSTQSFDDLEKKYDFDYMVFKSDQLWELRQFHRYIWESGKWALVYAGGDGFVYLKKNQKNRENIAKLALKKNPLIDEMKKAGEVFQAK